jgi:hypothetical protein
VRRFCGFLLKVKNCTFHFLETRRILDVPGCVEFYVWGEETSDFHRRNEGKGILDFEREEIACHAFYCTYACLKSLNA